jgi:hypothetical protein
MNRIITLFFVFILLLPALVHAQFIGNQGAGRAYTDEQTATALATANEYTDNETAATLAAAESYADAGDNQTLISAKDYTDDLESRIDPAALPIYTGTATDGGLNYLEDDTQTWTEMELAGKSVRFTTAGVDYVREIIGNDVDFFGFDNIDNNTDACIEIGPGGEGFDGVIEVCATGTLSGAAGNDWSIMLVQTTNDTGVDSVTVDTETKLLTVAIDSDGAGTPRAIMAGSVVELINTDPASSGKFAADESFTAGDMEPGAGGDFSGGADGQSVEVGDPYVIYDPVATRDYADTGDAATLTSAEDYADGAITAHKAEADAHELGNIDGVISEDTTITVAETGGDYNNIADAINFINGLVILGDNTVTLSIAAGEYSVTPNAVQLNTPYSKKVAITGAGYSSDFAGTHVRNITGSAGAWTVTLDMSATAWQSTVSEGDYIVITVAGSGLAADRNIVGIYPVTDVDTTDNRVSFTSQHKLDLETIVKDGGAFPVSSTITIKKALTVISCTGLTGVETGILFSSIPSSISGIATVVSGTGGTAIRLAGSGNLDLDCDVYVIGDDVEGIFTDSQMYVVFTGNISGGKRGIVVRGGTVYGSSAGIVGATVGVLAEISATYFSSFSCLIFGNTTGVRADSGSKAFNGYRSEIQYNTTGVDVSIFSSFGNTSGGVTTNNTDDYLQTPDTFLADGSYIYSAD